MFNENKQIITTDYEALRAWCRSQPQPQQQAFKAFISYLTQKHLVRKLKSKKTNFCYQHTSYGLKHVVERLSDVLGKHEYVSNEDFIIAMVQAGFDVKNACEKRQGNFRYLVSPNYYFNLPKFRETLSWQSELLTGVQDGRY